MRSNSHTLLAVLFYTAAAAPAFAGGSLTPLGRLPGGTQSYAFDLSADGSTVVGYGIDGSGVTEAFRWTSDAGMVGLGGADGVGLSNGAYGVSGDGSVVVGSGSNHSFGQAFRWTSGSGMVGLGYLPGGQFSGAGGVSSDGLTIVGGGNTGSQTVYSEAFRCTAAFGIVGLGHLPGDDQSGAAAASGDGSTVVGSSGSAVLDPDGLPTGSINVEAFRWTSGGGMVGLGDLPGGAVESGAYDVSADGSTIVGSSISAVGPEAFRWTAASGMVGLGHLPGTEQTYATGVSDDGSIVVGWSWLPTGSVQAFHWTTDSGMESLWDVLLANGVNPADDGWARLETAYGISADGNTIAGYGLRNGNSEAFIAVVPEPSGLALIGIAVCALLRRRAARRACCEPLEPRRLLSFTPVAESYPGGANPVTGDFNRDGRVDLAFVDTAVHVLRGDGDGTFRQPALTSAEGQTGPFPQSVVVGDFNGDGKLDLAAATYDEEGLDNNVRILLGNGDGTFAAAAPVVIGAGYSSNYVATGHLDGDGNLDLVVTSDDLYGFAGQDVSVWLGGGDGSFTWAAGYGIHDSNPVGDGPISAWAPVVADFDGDGDGDVAVAVSSSEDGGVAKVYLGNGNGTLQPPRDAVVFPDAFYYHFFSVLAGNFGGDARPDLVAGGVVLLSNGDGTFRKAGAIGALTESAGDINGDGRLDLVAASGGNVNAYMGRGDGTFAPPIATATGASNVNFVVLADLNADGRPDAVASNGDTGAVSVLLNDGVWPGSIPQKNFIGPGGAGSGGNWSNPGNWSPAGVPGAGDHVSIDGKSVGLGSSATVAGVTLTGGASLSVGANGSRVLRTSNLAIAATSTLDLNDNDLILDYASASPVGVWTGSAYDGVTGMIESGRITSSLPSDHLQTLGVAEARDAMGITGLQTATFAGQAVDSTSVLVKFTWGGDANLDGKINIDDYGQIDSNVAKSGSAFGYFNGDFNLDGKINIDDYGIIDSNTTAQDMPL